MNEITNVAAYKFVRLDRLAQRRKQLHSLCRLLKLRGTILLSPEGINLFMAGADESVQHLLVQLRSDPALVDLDAKFSYSDRVPFRRLLVKVKSEIITFAVEGIQPARSTSPRLPPEKLKQWLDEGKHITLLDVRNDYEIKLGAFVKAQPIGVANFRQFPEAVERLPEQLKRQPLVMYCTGGIRCEKAGPLMEQKGFQEVYQLEGGILRYLEKCGGQHFQGECFVFDQRVGLDHQLRETATTMCFACQMPLTPDEQQSPMFVVGKSCPYCYKTEQQTMQQAIARRHEQIRGMVDPLPGSIPYENRRPITVPRNCDGFRLHQVLTQLHPHVATHQWLRALELGRLQCRGEPLRADDIVRAGQRIYNVEPATVEPSVNADIQLLYEDAFLVVVNKPAPLPMHPCGRFNRNTLIWILNQVYRPQQLRVAHRLDANTTGVVVLSRSRQIAGYVQPQFERGEVDKRYLVRVQGVPPQDEFVCEAPINVNPGRAGQRVVDQDGMPSTTRFRVIQRLADRTTLLEVRPLTGRTNQIRLHLAYLGWPVCGDPTYGLPEETQPAQTLPVDAPPLCLHAWKITLRHPLDGKCVAFSAPPPAWSIDGGIDSAASGWGSA
jgi:RluA family pseudouridine synthase